MFYDAVGAVWKRSGSGLWEWLCQLAEVEEPDPDGLGVLGYDGARRVPSAPSSTQQYPDPVSTRSGFSVANGDIHS
ncbi:hypothetical protein SAMD00023353_0901780 [Rosellinia necatrix]|uniref:Uncharacterized protein n=1 Tax=Rosellinia necatrix TaxID=77044 RepID=A0A1S8A661_ROSNE|nr:hypothetical protein SAMD00023353_0901780 [Rosellinia necatrix]